jgi:hypothetical protein
MREIALHIIPETCRQSALGDLGEEETRRQGDQETGRQGDKEKKAQRDPKNFVYSVKPLVLFVVNRKYHLMSRPI